MDNSKYIQHIFRDVLIILASIFFAYLLVEAGIIKEFLNSTSDFKIFSAIVSGGFFTSIFTIAPSVVSLVALSNSTSPLFVATFGALGSALVDTIISSFVRKGISENLSKVTKSKIKNHFIKAFHFGFLKWIVVFIGVLVIASPLPDEFGLFLIGLSRIRPTFLPIVFYIANFLGIYAVVSIATI